MARISRAVSSLAILASMIAPAAMAAPERGLSGQAAVDATYDENSVGLGAGAIAAQNLRRSEVVVTPSAQLRYDMPVGRNAVFLEGSAGYDFHSRNKRLDKFRWSMGAGAALQIGSRCSSTLGAEYRSQQSTYGDLGVALDNLERTQDYNFSARCAAPIGIGVTGGISHKIGENSSILRQRSDLKSTSYFAGLIYNAPSVGTISLTGGRDDRQYPNRFVVTPLGLERDGVTVDRVSLAVERPIGARLVGSASISYIWTDPDVSITEDFKGVGWGAGLSYQLGSRTKVNLDTSKDTTSSAALDSSYQITRSYGLNASYQLGSQITLSAGGALKKRRFKGGDPLAVIPGPNGTVIPLPLRDKEKTTMVFAEIGYQLNRRLGFALNGAHEERKASGTFYDYSGNSVRLSTVFSF